MSSQSVETTCNCRFRFSPRIQFVLGIMSIMFACLSARCLFFLVSNWPTGSFRKQWGRSLSRVLWISVMTFLSAQWQNGLPCHLMSDNFPSPFPFTLANFVFLSCCRIFLRDRPVPYTSNNPAILLMLYHSVKQSAKQEYELCYLNLPPEGYNFL